MTSKESDIVLAMSSRGSQLINELRDTLTRQQALTIEIYDIIIGYTAFMREELWKLTGDTSDASEKTTET